MSLIYTFLVYNVIPHHYLYTHVYIYTYVHLLAVSMFGAEIGVWNLKVAITFPIFAVKEFMHVVKAVVGFQDIAAIDVRQRCKQN